MQNRLVIIVALIGASALLPMVVGALRGVGLSKAADGNQTFLFAENYYEQIMGNFSPYIAKRDKFALLGKNHYGVAAHGRSECQERLEQSFTNPNSIIGAALSSQRSLVLKLSFDRPGIEALESMPSFLLGALGGCRYTFLTFACDAWGRAMIVRANTVSHAALEKEKSDWLRENETASCTVAEKLQTAKS